MTQLMSKIKEKWFHEDPGKLMESLKQSYMLQNKRLWRNEPSLNREKTLSISSFIHASSSVYYLDSLCCALSNTSDIHCSISVSPCPPSPLSSLSSSLSFSLSLSVSPPSLPLPLSLLSDVSFSFPL